MYPLELSVKGRQGFTQAGSEPLEISRLKAGMVVVESKGRA